jgi:cardiolipin synthase
MLETLRTFIDAIDETVALIASAIVLFMAVTASIHALLYKRDVRAAIAWTSLIILVPFIGTILYVALGINRIQRKARALRRVEDARLLALPDGTRPNTSASAPLAVTEPLRPLARLVDTIARFPLTGGGTVTLLRDGDEAYPAMLAAIDAATRSIALSSYIFANDAIGLRFADALTRAHERGVVVRVLIDAVGARYSLTPITRVLKKRGVPSARFLPLSVLHWPFFNMRNHRKLLVTDGRVGFIGGLNIRDDNVKTGTGSHEHHIHDLHARVTGPVVAQLTQTLAEDWHFTTKEVLTGDLWFPEPVHTGDALLRVLPDGPGHDFDIARTTFLGALSVAKERVCIVTPYFLPDSVLIAALAVCARRGVTVDIVLPEKSNLRYVDWATRALLWQVLEPGSRVWLASGRFDHMKLMVVDDSWTHLGSANWDPRSLRLNFEANMECYDQAIAREAQALVDERMKGARAYTMKDADGRRGPTRVLHAMARLFSPFL